MNWSNEYFELAGGTLFAALGLTFVVLVRLKAARAEEAAGPRVEPPTSPPTMRLNVSFFFYCSALLYALAFSRMAPWPWTLLGLLVAVVALIPVVRATRSMRSVIKVSKKV